jgi:hypothetical protein
MFQVEHNLLSTIFTFGGVVMQHSPHNANWSFLPSVQSVGALSASSGAVAVFVGESSRAAGGFRAIAGFRSAGAAFRFAVRLRPFLPSDILRAVRPFGVKIRRGRSGWQVSVPVAPWSVPARWPVSVVADSPAAVAAALSCAPWAPAAPEWAPFYPPVPVALSPVSIWRRRVVGLRRWVLRAAWHLARRSAAPFSHCLRRAWQLAG